MTAPEARQLEPGQRVVWRHQPRGGYGYVIRVPATVVRRTAKRVLIAAQLKTGATKNVWTQPAALEAVVEMMERSACELKDLISKRQGSS